MLSDHSHLGTAVPVVQLKEAVLPHLRDEMRGRSQDKKRFSKGVERWDMHSPLLPFQPRLLPLSQGAQKIARGRVIEVSWCVYQKNMDNQQTDPSTLRITNRY